MRIEHFQRRDDRTSRCTIGNRSVRCQATSRQGQRPTKRCPLLFSLPFPSYSWLLHRAIEERHDLGSQCSCCRSTNRPLPITGNAVLLPPKQPPSRICGVESRPGGYGRLHWAAQKDDLLAPLWCVGVEGAALVPLVKPLQPPINERDPARVRSMSPYRSAGRGTLLHERWKCTAWRGWREIAEARQLCIVFKAVVELGDPGIVRVAIAVVQAHQPVITDPGGVCQAHIRRRQPPVVARRLPNPRDSQGL